MQFSDLLYQANKGDKGAVEQIIEMYRPLLIKNALIEGVFDEDLYQELVIETLKCIQRFKRE